MLRQNIQYRRPVRRCRRHKLRQGIQLPINMGSGPGVNCVFNTSGMTSQLEFCHWEFLYLIAYTALEILLSAVWAISQILLREFIFVATTIVASRRCYIFCFLAVFASIAFTNNLFAGPLDNSQPLTYPLILSSLQTRRIGVVKKAEAVKTLSDLNKLKPNTSYRKGEEATGIDHSTLHRWSQKSLQRIDILKGRMSPLKEENEHYAEEIDMFMSTPAGRFVLDKIFMSAIKNFIVNGRTGSDTVSKFFNDSSLDLFMSVSSRFLRAQAEKMQNDILDFKAIEVKRLITNKPQTVIAPLVDETWIGGDMILAGVDSISGYTIVEEKSESRTAEAWLEAIQKEIVDMNCEMTVLGSDEGSGLKSMAKQLGVARFSDLFHIDNEIFKGFMLELDRMIEGVVEEFENTKNIFQDLTNEKLQAESATRSPGRPINWEQRLIVGKKELDESKRLLFEILGLRSKLLQAVHKMNDCYHLVNLKTGVVAKTGKKMVSRMIAEIENIKDLAQESGISEQRLSKHLGKAIRAVANIEEALNKIIHQAKDDLKNAHLDKDAKKIFWEKIVPGLYYEREAKKSRTPARKRRLLEKKFDNLLKLAKQEIDSKFYQQALTIGHKLIWSFQRSSSPIEGINGSIARTYWTRRGLGHKAQQAIRILRDFDHADADGISNAEKFFRQKPRSLDEYLINKCRHIPEPLSLQTGRKRTPWSDSRHDELQQKREDKYHQVKLAAMESDLLTTDLLSSSR